MNLTKPSILILFVLLISVGVGTASALITITLAGNTIIQGTITADNYFDTSNIQTGVDSSALGGTGNDAIETLSTVGGGGSNTASGMRSTIGGGLANRASGQSSTVGGGETNAATEGSSTVGGGDRNTASGKQSTVGGGRLHTASGDQSTIGGGVSNTANTLRATVGGGVSNIASGESSTVPGGSDNEASGKFSFAAGNNAKALFDGDIVFADSNPFDFSSTAANQFFVRAIGGTTLVSGIDGAGVATSGVVLASGGNSWAGISDNRFKENISEFSVLDKLDSYRAVEFDWRSSGIHDVGVIGQELEQVFPELVNSGSNDGDVTSITDPGVWSVQYSKLGALALQAIKEQQTQIDEQNKLIDSLIDIICADNSDRQICIEN